MTINKQIQPSNKKKGFWSTKQSRSYLFPYLSLASRVGLIMYENETETKTEQRRIYE